MKDIKILRKAIIKAMKNGYKKDNNRIYSIMTRRMFKTILCQDFYRGIIFDHEFAKALWGEELIYRGMNINEFCLMYKYYKRGIREWNKLKENHFNVSYRLYKSWQYHLQQIVLEKEPLKYLEKFL